MWTQILCNKNTFQSHLERIGQRPGSGGPSIPALPPPAPTRFHTLFELGAKQSRKTLTPTHDTKSTMACIALAVSNNYVAYIQFLFSL